MKSHEHIWIEGPEIPLRYGSCLSRICTECGVYEMYDWYGQHRNYAWYVDVQKLLDESEEL